MLEQKDYGHNGSGLFQKAAFGIMSLRIHGGGKAEIPARGREILYLGYAECILGISTNVSFDGDQESGPRLHNPSSYLAQGFIEGWMQEAEDMLISRRLLSCCALSFHCFLLSLSLFTLPQPIHSTHARYSCSYSDLQFD
jgi:hypothetical protein